MKFYGFDFGLVWGVGIGYDEGDIFFDTNDVIDFRVFEYC